MHEAGGIDRKRRLLQHLAGDVDLDRLDAVISSNISPYGIDQEVLGAGILAVMWVKTRSSQRKRATRR
jgi:hypothetical protein